MELDDNLVVFNNWLYNCGCYYPQLALHKYGENSRGVHIFSPNKPVTNGDVLLLVPRQLLITVETAKASPVGQILASLPSLGSQSILACYLLQERQKGNASFWKPWLDVMPDNFNSLPMFFHAGDLALLNGCDDLLLKVDNQRSSMQFEYDMISSSCPAIHTVIDFALEDFVWACLAVGTRVFSLCIRGVKTSVLAPLADMMNHRNPSGTTWSFDSEHDAFSLVARCNLEHGEPVYESYGPKDNKRFFASYGFCLEDNPVHEVSMWMRAGFEPNSDNDSVRRFSLRIGYDALARDLISFLRVGHASPEQLAHWDSLVANGGESDRSGSVLSDSEAPAHPTAYDVEPRSLLGSGDAQPPEHTLPDASELGSDDDHDVDDSYAAYCHSALGTARSGPSSRLGADGSGDVPPLVLPPDAMSPAFHFGNTESRDITPHPRDMASSRCAVVSASTLRGALSLSHRLSSSATAPHSLLRSRSFQAASPVQTEKSGLASPEPEFPSLPTVSPSPLPPVSPSPVITLSAVMSDLDATDALPVSAESQSRSTGSPTSEKTDALHQLPSAHRQIASTDSNSAGDNSATSQGSGNRGSGQANGSNTIMWSASKIARVLDHSLVGPLSLSNELAALRSLYTACQLHLDRFDTSLEHDMAMLEQVKRHEEQTSATRDDGCLLVPLSSEAPECPQLGGECAGPESIDGSGSSGSALLDLPHSENLRNILVFRISDKQIYHFWRSFCEQVITLILLPWHVASGHIQQLYVDASSPTAQSTTPAAVLSDSVLAYVSTVLIPLRQAEPYLDLSTEPEAPERVSEPAPLAQEATSRRSTLTPEMSDVCFFPQSSLVATGTVTAAPPAAPPVAHNKPSLSSSPSPTSSSSSQPSPPSTSVALESSAPLVFDAVRVALGGLVDDGMGGLLTEAQWYDQMMLEEQRQQLAYGRNALASPAHTVGTPVRDGDSKLHVHAQAPSGTSSGGVHTQLLSVPALHSPPSKHRAARLSRDGASLRAASGASPLALSDAPPRALQIPGGVKQRPPRCRALFQPPASASLSPITLHYHSRRLSHDRAMDKQKQEHLSLHIVGAAAGAAPAAHGSSQHNKTPQRTRPSHGVTASVMRSLTLGNSSNSSSSGNMRPQTPVDSFLPHVAPSGADSVLSTPVKRRGATSHDSVVATPPLLPMSAPPLYTHHLRKPRRLPLGSSEHHSHAHTQAHSQAHSHALCSLLYPTSLPAPSAPFSPVLTGCSIARLSRPDAKAQRTPNAAQNRPSLTKQASGAIMFPDLSHPRASGGAQKTPDRSAVASRRTTGSADTPKQQPLSASSKHGSALNRAPDKVAPLAADPALATLDPDVKVPAP